MIAAIIREPHNKAFMPLIYLKTEFSSRDVSKVASILAYKVFYLRLARGIIVIGVNVGVEVIRRLK